MSDRVRVVVVTGLSGAGKSTALHALEDLGYFCVDNLPTSLLDRTVEVCEAGGIRRIALGIDVRVGSFLDGAVDALRRIGDPALGDGPWSGRSSAFPPDPALVDELIAREVEASGPASGRVAAPPRAPAEAEASGVRPRRDVVVLFLDASDEVLLRRFSETRRPHPLTSAAREAMRAGAAAAPGDSAPSAPNYSGVGAVAVLDGVQLERERLAHLRACATVVLDTTLLSVHDLRRQVIDVLGPGKAEQPRMVTRLVSFGFKFGVPVDADLVLDVRLLENPYFIPDLRPLPGTDPAIQSFLLKSEEAREFIRRLDDLLSFSLPRYEREGKSYLTIAIGCTGGRHRSVAVASLLSDSLPRKTGLPILVLHRDVMRADIFGSHSPPPRVGRGSGGGDEK